MTCLCRSMCHLRGTQALGEWSTQVKTKAVSMKKKHEKTKKAIEKNNEGKGKV
jgi:hypothetical protein